MDDTKADNLQPVLVDVAESGTISSSLILPDIKADLEIEPTPVIWRRQVSR